MRRLGSLAIAIAALAACKGADVGAEPVTSDSGVDLDSTVTPDSFVEVMDAASSDGRPDTFAVDGSTPADAPAMPGDGNPDVPPGKPVDGGGYLEVTAGPDGGWPDSALIDNGAACDGKRPGPRMVSHSVESLGGKVQTYCIDTTEVTNAQYKVFADVYDPAATPDFFCAHDRPADAVKQPVATPGDPFMPVVNVTWCNAWMYCKWAGKHLCGSILIDGGPSPDSAFDDPKGDEWTAACVGAPPGSVYPYGNAHEPGRCNDTSSTVARVGSFPGCRGTTGSLVDVYDMTGNVNEWQNSCNGLGGKPVDNSCHLRGNRIGAGAAARCNENSSMAMTKRSPDVGFRCCLHPKAPKDGGA